MGCASSSAEDPNSNTYPIAYNTHADTYQPETQPTQPHPTTRIPTTQPPAEIVSYNKYVKCKALIIGINYYNTEAQLNGCINDGNNIYNMLIDKFNFEPGDITFLHDSPENVGTNLYPTGQNIRKALKEIVDECRHNGVNKVWISYSGHGTSIKDYSMDELDKLDECICPVDYDDRTGGRGTLNRFIVDDEIYSILTKLPERCICFALMDCCHSGTIIDLTYLYDFDADIYKTESYRRNSYCPANIISISGCSDSQTSADAFLNKEYTGAMTYAFIKAINENSMLRYNELVLKMRDILTKKKFKQIPQLTSSQRLSDSIFYVKNGLRVFSA